MGWDITAADSLIDRSMALSSNHIQLLDQDPWFSKLPPHIQQRMLSIAMIKHIPAGQSIVERGQANGGVFCLLDGVVLAMNELEPGNQGVLAPFAPPAWFGEVGLADGGPYTHTMHADTACTLLLLTRTSLLALLQEEPVLWQHISMLLTAKLRISFFVLDEMVKPPAEQRVARRLLIQAAGLGLGQTYRPQINIDQEQLAQTMGMSRSTLNPILRRWSDAKWIQLTYGRITILNLDELKALAGVDSWPDDYKEALRTDLTQTDS